MKHDQFFLDLVQDVITRSETNGDVQESAFTEVVIEYLQETGDVADFIPCCYQARGLKVDGFGFSTEEATLDLFVCQYTGGATVETVSRTEMLQVFKRLETFFQKCLTPRFVNTLDAISPEGDAARQIFAQAGAIARVRFHLLTDSLLSDKVKDIPSKVEAGRESTFRVWDLDRLSKIMGDGEPEEMVVDFVEFFGSPLRCLPAASDHAEIQSYLAVIPGSWLASIYDRFAGRLLEQNVRTFLQMKGGVNKGIRQTILTEPAYFFSYNNGISATAEQATTVESNGVVQITSLHNLQIVNGGQTTASLFHCLKRDKNDLSTVHVQMKLSVLMDKTKVQELVPKIARYANSQNKISNADFFSTHPFHIRMEGFSRRLWAPAVGGSQIQTHWFYERARGQHANQMAYLTPAKRKEFLLQNPRHQVVSKTDVAKCFNTFRQMPQEVSRGAQKSFARFAEYVGDAWEKNDAEFNERWFQNLVAQAIVFRAAERLVQKASWYAGGYRANLVTYGLALLFHHYQQVGKTLDLKRIWLDQRVSDSFESQILSVSAAVLERIVAAAAEFGVSNVTEWCKKPGCWSDLKCRVTVKAEDAVADDLVSYGTAKQENIQAQKTQKFDNAVDALRFVVELGADYWKKVLDWSPRKPGIGPKDLTTLRMATAIPDKIPTDWQAARLMSIRELYEKSILER